MPILTRENLAQRFRQNWLSRTNTDMMSNLQVDDGLTSLSWLQNLNIMKMSGPQTSELPKLTPKPVIHNDMRVNPNSVLNVVHPVNRQDSTGSSGSNMSVREVTYRNVHPPMTNNPHVNDKVDYKSNPYVKPPYSYATLICMAMKETKKNKITLAGIYSWITENFMYYRMADPSWQNSIRHNLSLNKCFQKVARRKDEPGKGGFWRINPEHSDMFVNGIFKRRRSSVRENVATPPAKRVKQEEDIMLTSALSSDIFRTESEDNVVTINSDFNWNSILQQDIEIGGMRIKTEQLLDEHEVLTATDSIMDQTASPITELSPPPSDSNSDIGLDEFLSYDLSGPLDLTSGDPLDLSINGTAIKPPEWWTEGTGLLQDEAAIGLSNPIQFEAQFSHPWAESRSEVEEAIASLDFELHSLFHDDSLTNSSTYSDS